MKVYFLLSVLFATAYYSHAEDNQKNNSIKEMIIREIMRKVSNITLSSLSKVTDDKKELVLSKIEQKLRKTAAGLTGGQKYVKLIMEQFKNKAFHQDESKKETNKKDIARNVITEHEKSNEGRDVLRAAVEVSSKEGSLEANKPDKKGKIFDDRTKEHIIQDISAKIESMAKGYLRESQTMEQKQKIFDKIKKRIIESSKRKHMLIHSQHNELKAYTNLITQGLELSMKKLLLASKARRMSDVKEPEVEKDAVDNNTHATNMAYINDYKNFFAEIWNETSMDPRCNAIVEEICFRISSLHKLTCRDGKIISLEQLCDGVSDCWNEADETNCTVQAIEKSRLAIALMSDIDQSTDGECFQQVVENQLFLHQHRAVRSMLEEQLKLLQKYKRFNIKTILDEQENDDEELFLKTLIKDVTKTVTSLSDAFDANLCSPRDEVIPINNLTRKSIDPEAEDDFKDYDAIHGQPKWSPKSCTCTKQFCKMNNCDPRCKRICWQKYSLSILQCQSISGGTYVSLDLICDGKLDCFDEADEISCTTDSSVTKYEANAMYKDLLEILSLKSLSMEFEQSRNRLVAQTNSVRQLQQLSTKPYVDVHAVKMVRDKYFKTLSQIYLDMLQTTDLQELDKIYEFLHVLNEKMVKALKLSHTGNEHVVAPAGCYCNNGTCALVRCPRKCVATCLIEPLLTRYSCNDNNTSVHIKAVCNGKKECSNGEDEKDCQKEVCRAHHLVLLRHNLQRAGISLKGSVLGDVLDGWKSKVMSSLIIAQGSERPNHKMLEDIVIKVLGDLVTSFASMEETKRTSPEFVTNEFLNMSSIVKQTLKYCEH